MSGIKIQKAEEALVDLKKYLSKLPKLVLPTQGEVLYLYISVLDYSVSVVLVMEKGKATTARVVYQPCLPRLRCPVFCDEKIYLRVGNGQPKVEALLSITPHCGAHFPAH